MSENVENGQAPEDSQPTGPAELIRRREALAKMAKYAAIATPGLMAILTTKKAAASP